jgi:Methyltransferase domain
VENTNLTHISKIHLRLVRDVEGWLSLNDVLAFNAFNFVHETMTVKGDILEIGSFKGKSAIILANFLRDKERLFICDVFEDINLQEENLVENLNSYPNFVFDQFRRNFLRHVNLFPEILRFDSKELKSRIGNQRFRFIHIDGSHNYEWIRSDIDFSVNALIENGVIAIDDFRSAHTPGVALATWESVLENDVTPILLSGNKIYLSKKEWSAQLMMQISKTLESCQVEFAVEKLKSFSFLRLLTPKNYDKYDVQKNLGKRISIHLRNLRKLF